MQLSKETIQEFKKIYLRKEGKELTDQEAPEIATNLILAFGAIYHPISAEEKKARQDKKPSRRTMDKKPSQKLKKKPLPVELIYRQVGLSEEIIPGMDKAFDILFDEVLRRRGQWAGGSKSSMI